MRVCVFGASGPVGRAVVAQALEAGHDVTAVTRRPDDFGLSASRLDIFGGDVLQLSDVEAAVSGADAVISAIGVRPSREAVTTYSAGIANIIEAMRAQGQRRIVCVSSKELDERGAHDEPLLYRFIFARLLGRLNRTLYDDMRRMEERVRASTLDWTIVRPAGLFAANHVSDYRRSTGHEPGVSTSTADLADALLHEAADDLGVGQTLQVLTDTNKPPYLILLAKQFSLHQH